MDMCESFTRSDKSTEIHHQVLQFSQALRSDFMHLCPPLL